MLGRSIPTIPDTMRFYLNQHVSCFNRNFIMDSRAVQIDKQRIIIKRIEIDIAQSELEVCMLLAEITQDKERYASSVQHMSADSIDAHNWSIARRYCEVEKYQLDVRHHQRRLAHAKEHMEILLAQPD